MLLVQYQNAPSKRFVLDSSKAVKIGRDADCDIQLDDPSVSRWHAQIVAEDGLYWLTDLDSKNGTFRGTKELTEAVVLNAGDRLSIGKVLCEFHLREHQTDSSYNNVIRFGQWQRKLQSSLGIEPLVEESVRAILELSNFERGFALLKSTDDSWQVVANSGIDTSLLESTEFSGSLSCVRRCVSDRMPVILHQLDPASWLAGQPSVVEGGIQAMLCLPLAEQNEIVGVIYADRTSPGEPLDDLELSILESLAAHAAMALTVSKMEMAMHALAAKIPSQSDTQFPNNSLGSVSL